MTSRKDGLMRVFWPSHAPRDDIPGVLVGWRNSEWDVLIIGVLQGVDARNVEHALRMRTLFRGSPHPIDNILQRCGGQPVQVLGTLNVASTSKTFDPKLLSLHIGRKNNVPRVECPADAPVTLQIIAFDRPDPVKMQYLSLTPISLTLGDKRGAFGNVPPFDMIDKEEEAAKKQKDRMVEKLKLHTVIRHPRTQKELALPTIIIQINCSAELDALMQQNIGLVGLKLKRSLSVSEMVVESATNLWEPIYLRLKQAFIHHIYPLASQFFILTLITLRLLAEAALLLLDWRPFHHAALKDLSATAQQIDIRLQQFCYWPAQYLTLHRRRNDWESITHSHAEYIRFFNSLWLVANDVILGIALGSYLLDNVDAVSAQLLATIDAYSITGLQSMLAWLMDNPAGLKLNTELATFLGDLFLWVIDYWAGTLAPHRSSLPTLIRLIALTSFLGASLPIALVSDLLSLLTLHIYSFYIASARIYNWQLTIITSLFHLFRGKKRNVLRHRIDSCDYDLDQLLLGTILFTLLFFLLPTVGVFYATFAGARMGILGLKGGLDAWLAVLNHFPLFAVMLRGKDSRRLPGGVRFELLPSPPGAETGVPTAYVRLVSIPLPLPSMFAQYAALLHRLRKFYAQPRVGLALLSGRFVPPMERRSLYSLQYGMLPGKRVGVGELWGMLVGESGDGGTGGGGGGGRKREKGRGKAAEAEGYWWSR